VPRPPFLPCSWHSPLDTALVPAHFEKQRVGSGAQKQQLSKMGALKAKGQGAAAAGGAQQQQQHGGAVGGGARKPGTPGAKGAVGNVVSAVSPCQCCGWLVDGLLLVSDTSAGVRHQQQPSCRLAALTVPTCHPQTPPTAGCRACRLSRALPREAAPGAPAAAGSRSCRLMLWLPTWVRGMGALQQAQSSVVAGGCCSVQISTCLAEPGLWMA
jgi:hypothetical protein